MLPELRSPPQIPALPPLSSFVTHEYDGDDDYDDDDDDDDYDDDDDDEDDDSDDDDDDNDDDNSNKSNEHPPKTQDSPRDQAFCKE